LKKTACPSCGQGTCSDGMSGSGACTCKTGWISSGGNCNACATGYYGSSCTGNQIFWFQNKN